MITTALTACDVFIADHTTPSDAATTAMSSGMTNAFVPFDVPGLKRVGRHALEHHVDAAVAQRVPVAASRIHPRTTGSTSGVGLHRPDPPTGERVRLPARAQRVSNAPRDMPQRHHHRRARAAETLQISFVPDAPRDQEQTDEAGTDQERRSKPGEQAFARGARDVADCVRCAADEVLDLVRDRRRAGTEVLR